MSRVDKCAWIVALAVCGGCAHMPDATVKYYLAQTKANFKVTRIVACDAQNKNIVVTNSVVPTISHFADRRQLKAVSLAPLKGFFSNSDVKFEFLEDGRLKGVNASSTGQGEAILKTALSIASTVGLFADSRVVRAASECAEVGRVGNQKAITLTYEADVDLEKAGKQVLPPDTVSAVYVKELKNAISPVCAVVKEVEPAAVPISYSARSGDVLLHARQPGLVRVRLAASNDAECDAGDTIWDGKVLAGQRGTDFSMPIPAAAVFGKQTFAVTVEQSGAVTMVQYATETGTGQVLNVISSGLTEMQNEATRRANALNAEASLIAAQQRLAKCKADPANCS